MFHVCWTRLFAEWLQSTNVRGRGPRIVVIAPLPSTLELGVCFPGLGGLKETKMFLPHPLIKFSIMGSHRDREVACSVSDLQGLHFESCVCRTVSSHHPREALLAKFSLFVHKSGLKPDSFHLVAERLFAEWLHSTKARGDSGSPPGRRVRRQPPAGSWSWPWTRPRYLLFPSCCPCCCRCSCREVGNL